MKDQARAVVVGGGITGCSVLYHLAKSGWTDVVLVEKGELTSGATCHAAGTLTRFNASPTIMRMRRYSTELYQGLNAFSQVGSVNIASSPEMLKTLQRNVSRAKGLGLNAEIISAQETLELIPWMSSENLYGSVYLPEDGLVDPHETTYAVAKAATQLGAEIYARTRLTGIEISTRGEVTGVKTDKGDIRCEVVVNAAGLWGAQVAAMAGVVIPSTPVIHQHIALEPVKGHEIPAASPTFRDYEYLVYGRPESGGYLVGGWELDPPACWVDGVPWEHEAMDLPDDFDRFAPMLEDTIKRMPFLADAGIIRLVAHPDAFTPDAGPLLGEWPGRKGFWLACASSMQGFGGGGGIGKAMAEWIIDGQTEWDLYAYRAWRFGRNYHDPFYAAERARECYKYYYYTHYPHDESTACRPRRISPLHQRMQELGAVFGTKNGWERVNYFNPGQGWRFAGEDQRQWGGWRKPPYFDAVGQECEAVRRRVGMIDMSSFGKIDLKGPGALPLLQRLAGNDMDRPAGTVIYTQFLDRQGGIVGDVTVTRLADDHFRIISGSAHVDSDLGWIRTHLMPDDPPVAIRDVTEDLAVIGLCGPRSREVLSAVTDSDVSDAALTYMTARAIDINGIDVLAQRISYTGELGWELYVPADRSVFVWDRLWQAGRGCDVKAYGYKAVDALRLEKGYAALTSDITAGENPYEARLDFCVNLKAGEFIGRRALLQKKADGIGQRLHTLVIGSEDYLTLYGGEAVSCDGQVISRLRSAGYGYAVAKNIGFAYLPVERVPEKTKFEVEIFGEMVAAQVAADVLYDPAGKALKM
jgi:glycine cleavage system aminomethyltransferase T/glycine/D-amino acid oxidase-like deaminating enzyme